MISHESGDIVRQYQMPGGQGKKRGIFCWLVYCKGEPFPRKGKKGTAGQLGNQGPSPQDKFPSAGPALRHLHVLGGRPKSADSFPRPLLRSSHIASNQNIFGGYWRCNRHDPSKLAGLSVGLKGTLKHFLPLAFRKERKAVKDCFLTEYALATFQVT